MNTPNLSLSDLAASIADGKAIDWEELKSSTTTPQDLALLSEMETIARISEMKWSTLRDQPTRKLTPDRDAGPTFHQAGKPNAATPPQRWGHLEILERIGGGGFGEVYRARDSRLEREVALKLLRRKGGEAFELDSSVLKEGRLLARLRHPNVATIYGVDQYEGQVGLWMEFVRGKTLEALLQEQGPLGAREAVGIGLDLCRALAAVHGAGLIHGDIKAQNVIREEGGRIVLADFGLGRDLERNPSEPLQGGTPPCMAPELLRGGQVTVRSDIYALGVLLFRLLTGTFPVRGRSIEEALHNMELGEIKPLRDLRPDLPEGLTRVVERALLGDPMRRFATPGEFERALTSSLGPESAFWPFPWIREPLPTWLHYSILLTLGIGVLSVLLVLRVIPPFWESAPKQREWVFVADFENRTDIANADLAIREFLTVALEQSTYLKVFPRGRAIEILRLMQKQLENTRFDAQIGREIAVRGHVKTMISGEIVPLDKDYQVLVRVTDPHNDESQAVVTERFRTKEELPHTVDLLAQKLRVGLGEHQSRVAERSHRLEDVTTASFEAWVRFAQALDCHRQYKVEEAHALLRSATEIDSSFAMAYRYLAIIQGGLGRDHEALASAMRGYELRQQVTPRERHLIEGQYHAWRGEYESALESYRTVTVLYPYDDSAFRALAFQYSILLDYSKAVETIQKAVELNPDSVINHGLLVTMLVEANRYEDALREVQIGRSKFTNGDHFRTGEGLALIGLGNIDAARDTFQALTTAGGMARSNAMLNLTQILILEGKIQPAEETLREGIGIDLKINHRRNLAKRHLWLARLLWLQDRKGPALRQIEAAAKYEDYLKFEGSPEKMDLSPPDLDNLRWAALLLAEMGENGLAEKMVRQMEKLSKQIPSVRNRGFAAHTRGDLHRVSGRIDLAKECLEEAIVLWKDAATTNSLALLAEDQKDFQRALSLYKDILFLKGSILSKDFSPVWILAHLHAARCEQMLNHYQEAAGYYDSFLKLWGSDSGLKVVIAAEDERKRLPL